MIATLAAKSLRSRGVTAVLTIISIALAVALLLAVERIRNQAKESFRGTISGTDVIVGARTSPVHLLLFSVFRIGDATNDIAWNTYRAIAERPDVRWTIPIVLGDSHRGFRVLATNQDYFEHLRYGGNTPLSFVAGGPFAHASEAVVGHDVADSLGYDLDRDIVLAHGSGEVTFTRHARHPFRIVGILARTGTPADRTVHVPLEGLAALHRESESVPDDPLLQAARARAPRGEAGDHAAERNEPTAVTALFIGLQARGSALAFQRSVNERRGEPLTAILPGVTLLELWSIVDPAERALLATSVLVVAVGLCCMLVALLTGLNERRREMAVLRSVGARPRDVFALVLGEATLLTLVGILLGTLVAEVATWAAQATVVQSLGFRIQGGLPSGSELALLGAMAAAGALVGIIPAYRLYRLSLADGMAVRL